MCNGYNITIGTSKKFIITQHYIIQGVDEIN